MVTEGIYEIAGARDLIAKVPDDRWAVVTSGTRAIAEFRLNLVGIPIPRVMVCADEISHGKPHPEGYLTAAAGLGIEPRDCVVIEDAPPGIDAAHAAAMRVIAVSTTYPRRELVAAESVIDRLDQLRITIDKDGIRLAV